MPNTFKIHSTGLNEDITIILPDDIVNSLIGLSDVPNRTRLTMQYSANDNFSLTSPTIVSGSNSFTLGVDSTLSGTYTTSLYYRLAFRCGTFYNHYSTLIQYLKTLKYTVDGVDYHLSDFSYLTTISNGDYPIPITLSFLNIDYWGKTITFSVDTPSTPKATFDNNIVNAVLDNPQTVYESETTYNATLATTKGHYFYGIPFIRYVQGGIIKTKDFTQNSIYSYSISFNEIVDNNSTIEIVCNDNNIVRDNIVNVQYECSSDIDYLPVSTINENDLPTSNIFKKTNNRDFSIYNFKYYDSNNVLQAIQGVIDQSNSDEVIINIPNTVTFYPNSQATFEIKSVGQSRSIIYHTSNCTSDIHPTIYNLGDSVVINFQSNSGYYFNSNVMATYIKNGEIIPIYADISNDVYALTLNINNIDADTSIDIFAYAILENSEVGNIFNNTLTIYKVNPSNMEFIAKQRFRTYKTDYNYTEIDLGKYIKSMKRFFIDITPDYASTIKLGNVTLPTVAETINNIFIDIVIGTFTIDRIYNNENDFTDIDIFAHLKYCGIVKLDTSIFIDKTVKIIYRVNLINAECKVLFFDNTTNNLLYSTIANISVNVPYMLPETSQLQSIENDFIENNNLYKDLENKIIIKHKQVVNNLYYDCNFTETLSNLSGYFEIDNIDLIPFDCLAIEKEMIESELKKGVFLTNE